MADDKPSNPPTKDGRTDSGGPDKPRRPRPLAPAGWVVGLLLLLTLLMATQQLGGGVEPISYSFFREQVLAGNVESIRVSGESITGSFKGPPRSGATPQVGADDSGVSDEQGKEPPGEAEGKTQGSATAPAPAFEGDGDADGGQAEPTATGDEPGGENRDGQESSGGSSGEASGQSVGEASGDSRPKKFVVDVQGGVDPDLRAFLDENGVNITFESPVDWGGVLTLVWFGVLIALAVMMFSFFRRTRDQMMGGGMLGGVTKSPARKYDAEDGPKITFDDVAGLKGVKTDLKEIVEFLRDPEKFQRLGARVPKGVLMNGPPGTGKTLLAKAVAGEAGVPFFSINGSEFIQMFVGVGASRVRDMFKTAKKGAPSILFIDEIDAVGRQRGAGLGGGHDEREQTLNQILSEMDGFSPAETVIVIAATNRPDVLDPALMRPGRFDRHVTVDRPSVEGRRQLFDVHTREVPVGDDVDFEKLARGTTGMTGADIANLVNEAALWATRNDRKFVTTEDFEYARDKALMGATREDVLTEEERKMTAYHEAGHALVAWMLPDCDPVHKVTIIPRGRALGVTQLVPEEDKHSQTKSEMQSTLAMALAGRAAELLVFDEQTTGASNDLERSTQLARRMVTHWGMSERIGPVAHHSGGPDPFLGREIVQEQKQFSEHTAQIIDDEVSKILHSAADRAMRILSENRGRLDALTNALLEDEEVDDNQITKLIGPSAQTERTALAPPIEIAPPSPAPAPTRSSSDRD